MNSGPGDLVDPEQLPECVPRELYDACVEAFLAVAFLTDRPSGVRENKTRVGITGSSSIMCKLQAAEVGSPLVVVPLGLIARAYTLALVLEAHDGGPAIEIIGDEKEIVTRLTTPPGLAAIFERSSESFWDRLRQVQDSFRDD